MSNLEIEDKFKPLNPEEYEKFSDLNHIYLDDSRFMALAPLELLRVLVDSEQVDYQKAVSIVSKTFSCKVEAFDDYEPIEITMVELKEVLPRHAILIQQLQEDLKDQIERDPSLIETFMYMDVRVLEKLGELIDEDNHGVIDMQKLSKVLVASHIFEGGNSSKEGIKFREQEHKIDDESNDVDQELITEFQREVMKRKMISKPENGFTGKGIFNLNKEKTTKFLDPLNLV